MFFNEKGILNIDEMVANNDSFKRIMEDNTVDENEIKEQSDKVVAMLHQMEKSSAKSSCSRSKSCWSRPAYSMPYTTITPSNT